MKKANIVFLFMSQSSASPGATPDNWEPTEPCGSFYNSDFAGEGYFKMLSELKKKNIIGDLKIFYESNRAPGYASWIDNADMQAVVPEFRFIKKHIKEDTIIFVRGGFKHWHDWLTSHKGKNWLMLYAANTGRQRWTWWDIVLNDLEKCNNIDKDNRYWYHFTKPVCENMFYPENYIPSYDFCIGASHIHDKKGQHHTIKALIEYKKMFGKCPKCIMPGSPRRGKETLQMFQDIKNHNLDIHMIGMVKRNILKNIFNSSKYFIHLGHHGQNDRGPLEALACGTPLIIGSPNYHSPIVHEDKNITFVPNDFKDSEMVARNMNKLLNDWTPEKRDKVYNYYKEKSGFNEVVMPKMSILFSMMANNPPTIKNKQKIKEMFYECDMG